MTKRARFLVEYRAATTAAIVAAVVAVAVTTSIVGGSSKDVKVHNASADVQAPPADDATTTTTTVVPTTTTSPTTTAPLAPTTSTAAPAIATTTTSTTTPRPSASATVGTVEYREDGPVTPHGSPLLISHVPVTLTMTNGPVQRVMVCLRGTIDNTNQPYGMTVGFNDVNGSATQEATYGYDFTDPLTNQYYVNKLLPDVTVTQVHIVTSPWDPTSCPPLPVTPPLPAPANLKLSSAGDSLVQVNWDQVPGATGYVVTAQTYGEPVLADCCTAQLHAPDGAWIWVQARAGLGQMSAPATVRWQPAAP